MLRGAAGIGAAGLAAGVLAGAVAVPAGAATMPKTEEVTTTEPMTLFLKSAPTGAFELYVGEREVLFHDRGLADRIARLAR